MRKSIVTIIAIMFTVTAFAQFTNQGTFLLGGSSNLGLNFLSSKFKVGNGNFQDGGSKTTSFEISPQVGYFVIDNFAIGAGISFSTLKDKDDFGEFTSSTMQFGPLARYYFDKFYAEGSYGFGSSKTSFDDSESNLSISTWTIAGGYAVLVSDNVALEPQVGYLSNSLKNKDTDVTSKNAGLFARLSLFVYLSK